MTYWEKLEKRSEDLWQALFGQSALTEGSVPVYINARAVQKSTAREEGAAETPLPSEEDTETTGAVEAEAALSEQETARQRAAAAAAREEWQSGTEQDAPESSVSGEKREDAPEERARSAPGGAAEEETERASSAGAARLLGNLRTLERSAAAQMQRTAASAGTETELWRTNARQTEAADWSVRFERDARRYDGGFELL